MGVGGISVWQLLIILLIVVLLFGTKRLKSIGSDLGNAVKGFRSAMGDKDKDDDADADVATPTDPKQLDQNRPAATAGGQQRTSEGQATGSKPADAGFSDQGKT